MGGWMGKKDKTKLSTQLGLTKLELGLSLVIVNNSLLQKLTFILVHGTNFTF